MKRNKVAKLIAVVALVGVVGIGGSLALLTAETQEVTNTFTVGKGLQNEDLELDEKDVDNSTAEKDRDKQNAYRDLEPNTFIEKDPQVRLINTNDRADSYVFIRVDGCDEFMAEVNHITKDKVASTFKDWNSKWFKISNEITAYDGIYVYSANSDQNPTIVKGTEGFEEFVFKGINLSKDANLYSDSNNTLNQIQIDACAVQAAGDTNTYENALAGLPKDFLGNYTVQ